MHRKLYTLPGSFTAMRTVNGRGGRICGAKTLYWMVTTITEMT